MDSLANRLTTLMQKQNLSSSELARLTGITQPVIYRLMTGQTENPQIFTIKPIADYFGISIDQLMGFLPLQGPQPLDNITLHNISNKLTTIITVASTVAELTPKLEMAYKAAFEANLIIDDLPIEILPLVHLNVMNLIKAAEYIREAVGLTKDKTP